MAPYASPPTMSSPLAHHALKPERAPSGPYCGTKTVYPEPPLSSQVVRAPRDSVLVHVSFIARHGTRNPTTRGLRRMRALEQYLRAAAPHLPWLAEWNRLLDAYEAAEGKLTVEGEAEMRALGERFRTRYACLLGVPGLGEQVVAWASAKQRAVESAGFFLQGFEAANRRSGRPKEAGRPATTVLHEGEDAVVRYTQRHSEYTSFSARHKEAVFSALTSGKTKRATEIASRMAAQLGARELQPDHVRVVAEVAAFDLAHGRKATSHFAQLLQPSDASFLEAFDRAYRPFWEGVSRYRAVAAPLIRELVDTLKLAKAGRAPGADLKFAHAQTLVPLLLLLGIEGNGLCPRRGEYVPGLSAMSPFAANFCMELFQTNARRAGQALKFLVRFRLHERYIASVPALGEHGRDGVVPLERLLDFFGAIIDEDSSVCKVNGGNKGATVAAGPGHGSMVPLAIGSNVVPVPGSARAVAE